MNLEISRLSNGLTVITDPMAGLESAALGVWVSTGSRNELPAQMGISHMLEHMAFKGTATPQRPPDRRRDRERWAAISTPIPAASRPPFMPGC